MRHFIACIHDRTGLEAKAWEDAGFTLLEEITVMDQTQTQTQAGPDLVLWRWSAKAEHNDTMWSKVEQLLPKLYIIISDTPEDMLPQREALAGIYEQHAVSRESLVFHIGNKTQGIINPEAWKAWGSNVMLDEAGQVRAVADTAYRFLLQDVFRETFEWCGHTFSVLGPG